MKFKSLTVLVALIPLIAFAAATQVQHPSEANAPATFSQHYSEYRNDQWHFSIFVPSNFTVASYDQRGGITIQFIDDAGNILFQVSAWQYKALVVHADSFRLQSPSLEGDQGDELGTVGVVEDDLVEFLFGKNGISYVVQTLPENAASTLDILKSWEFI